MRRYDVIITFQGQVRKLTIELEWVKGSEHWAPHRREFDHNIVDINYSSSHEDHEGQGVRGRGPFRDDLNDLKIEALEFDGNLKPENYIDWVQALGMIIELTEYNDEKAFKFVILKLKGFASLWHETLKTSWARETKTKIMT